MRYLVILLALLLGGCASAPGLYLDVVAAYQIDDNSDWYVQRDRDWQCDRPLKAEVELGYEITDDWSVGYHHQSWWRCGGPFNDRNELYQDDIRTTYRFGGR